jgi:hypothetical protein
MNATFLRGPVLLLGLLLGLQLPIAGCSSPASKSLAAAERGDAEAQLELGTRYARGKGVDNNDAEAAKWLRKAADQGLARAQLDIGVLCAAGRGVPRDDAEAARWYRKAADQGLPQAQLNLGLAYDLGLGVHVDEAEAVSWWQTAAEQGDKGAAQNLVQLRAQRWTPPPCADNGIPKAWQCRTMPPRLSVRP